MTPKPKTKTVQLLTLHTPEQVAAIRAAAQAAGISVGALVRDACTVYLARGPVSIAVHLAEDDPQDYASAEVTP